MVYSLLAGAFSQLALGMAAGHFAARAFLYHVEKSKHPEPLTRREKTYIQLTYVLSGGVILWCFWLIVKAFV